MNAHGTELEDGLPLILLLTRHSTLPPCSGAAWPCLSLSSHIFSYLPCIIIAYRADLGPCQPLIEAHQLFSEVQQSCGQSFSLQLLPLTQLGRLIVNYLRMPSSALGSASVESLLFWTLLVFGLNLQIKQTHHTTPHLTTQSLHNMLIISESNSIIFRDLKWSHGGAALVALGRVSGSVGAELDAMF